MTRPAFLFLTLALAPAIAVAQDTLCTMVPAHVRMDSGASRVGLLKPGKLYIRGEAFGGEYVPVCKLDDSAETGKPHPDDPTFSITVSAEQCDRWVTAAELALALEMEVTLAYEASVQPDCENLKENAYPYMLTVAR